MTLTLTSPLMISARLLPAIRIGEATISLDTETMRFLFDLPGQPERIIDGYTPAHRSDPSELVRMAFSDLLTFASASNERVEAFDELMTSDPDAAAEYAQSDDSLFEPDIRDFFHQHKREIEELSMEFDEE